MINYSLYANQSCFTYKDQTFQKKRAENAAMQCKQCEFYQKDDLICNVMNDSILDCTCHGDTYYFVKPSHPIEAVNYLIHEFPSGVQIHISKGVKRWCIAIDSNSAVLNYNTNEFEHIISPTVVLSKAKGHFFDDFEKSFEHWLQNTVDIIENGRVYLNRGK